MAEIARTDPYATPRRASDEAIAQINQRLAEGEARMGRFDARQDRFESGLAENTAATMRIETSTARLVSIMGDIESGAAAMCRVAKGVKTVMDWLQQALETFLRYRYALLLIYFGLYFLIHGFTLPDWALAMLANATGLVLAP